MLVSSSTVHVLALHCFIFLSFICIRETSAAAGDDSKSPAKILCYSCMYYKTIDDKYGEHVEGEPNCKDTFNTEDIPHVACSGPCAKNIIVTRPNEYMLTRGCQPNCKEKAKDNGSLTKCCNSRLCNTAKSYRRAVIRTIVLALLTATFLSAV